MSPTRRTAADRRKLRQDNVNLEFLIRRTRRRIRNESSTVVDRSKKPPAIADVKGAMSKHAMQRCQLHRRPLGELRVDRFATQRPGGGKLADRLGGDTDVVRMAGGLQEFEHKAMISGDV